MFDERVQKEAEETNTPQIDINPAAASYAYDATWSIALALNQSMHVMSTGMPIICTMSYLSNMHSDVLNVNIFHTIGLKVHQIVKNVKIVGILCPYLSHHEKCI